MRMECKGELKLHRSRPGLDDRWAGVLHFPHFPRVQASKCKGRCEVASTVTEQHEHEHEPYGYLLYKFEWRRRWQETAIVRSPGRGAAEGK